MRAATAAALIDLATLDHVRREANGRLNPDRKAKLGQFMTPGSVAGFMAGLFSGRNGTVRLLDAGAGVGSLTAAFIGHWGPEALSISAYEIDPTLAGYLRETLARYNNLGAATIIESDFIRTAVYALKLGHTAPGFTHAILNPTYKRTRICFRMD